jgi:drug/metabolite transporter (DMT)-like permease
MDWISGVNMTKNNDYRLPLAAYVLTVLFAGFNPIGVHFSVLELPLFWSAALRLAPAALIMFILVFFLKLPLPKGRALFGAIIFGVLNFGGSFAFIYFALTKIQPGMASVILALVPLFTLFFAALHKQEAFRWRTLLGALFAAGGIALIFWEQLRLQASILHLLAMMLGVVCFAEANVIAKSFPKSHPITTNAIGMSIGAIILLLLSFLARENQILPVKTQTLVSLIFLILFGSCAVFTMTLFILKRWSASTLSYQFVMVPFVTLTASALIAHEALSPILLIGAALVVIGVFFGVLSSLKKRHYEHAPITKMDNIEQGSAVDC